MIKCGHHETKDRRYCPGCGAPKSRRAALCRSCSTQRAFDDRYLGWRQKVFAQDDYTCQACGRTDRSGQVLQAHHIENYRRQIHLRYRPENGITFCRRCHERFHDRFGRWGNNWRQCRDFIRDEEWQRLAQT